MDVCVPLTRRRHPPLPGDFMFSETEPTKRSTRPMMRTAAVHPAETEQWVAGLRAGVPDVIAALRGRIRDGLAAAFATRTDVNDNDLDDFTQDAVIRVLERIDTFRGESGFATWALAVAVRVAFTELRRRRFSDRSLDDPDGSNGPPIEDSIDTGTGLRTELFDTLRAAVADELTPRQREVLLAEVRGIPQVVLAERLNSTPGAVYKMSHDARKKLRCALQRSGYDAETVHEALRA